MSKLIYAVVYNNGQVDAWSTNQGPPAMPYVPECEVISEIDRLNEEVKELKEKIAIKDDVICASKLIIEAYEKREVQGE